MIIKNSYKSYQSFRQNKQSIVEIITSQLTYYSLCNSFPKNHKKTNKKTNFTLRNNKNIKAL